MVVKSCSRGTVRLFGRPTPCILPVAAALFHGSVGCEPTCENTCEKLLECDEVDTPRVSEDDCTTSCIIQEEMYEDWEDAQLREAHGDAKQCIKDNTCEDLATGTCYEDELFIW